MEPEANKALAGGVALPHARMPGVTGSTSSIHPLRPSRQRASVTRPVGIDLKRAMRIRLIGLSLSRFM